MKFSVVLALPALAIAAATPAVEERQLGLPLPALPLDLDCLLGVTGILACVPEPNPATLLSDLVGCPLRVVLGALSCVTAGLPGLPGLPPLPVPKN